MTDGPRQAPEPPDSAPSSRTPRYGIQLHDAYVVELSAARKAGEETADSGTIEVAQPDARREEDGRHFAVVWRATVVAPVGAIVSEISCAVEGQFGSDEPLSGEEFEQFKRREAFVLLWPYIRAAVGETGRMLGVLLPPLPTIDVRSILGVEGTEEEQQPDPATG